LTNWVGEYLFGVLPGMVLATLSAATPGEFLTVQDRSGAMNSSIALSPFSDPRLGFHYFPDTLHYRGTDLAAWLPVLQDLGATWLVLRSEVDRAIPEHFLRGLKQAGIEPLVQFHLPLDRLPERKELGTLVDVYARWGARYVIFYDRPNTRTSWPATVWAQQDLVERFLDRFLPPATLALQAGMIPVVPPLQPGGSYWDTAFLRSALQGILRRKQDLLRKNLVLSAYAWSPTGQSLNWGAGGPARWTEARPYVTPKGSENQCGFRIYEWYAAVARDVLQTECPILLLQAGLSGDPANLSGAAAFAGETSHVYAAVARLLSGQAVIDPLDADCSLEPLPESVISCAFWLLGAFPGDPYSEQAWFQGGDRRHPALVSLLQLRAEQRQEKQAALQRARQRNDGSPSTGGRAIRHYLLLPGQTWGPSDWYLEVIRPYVKRHRPTVGFSWEEAARAQRVTVVGGAQHYPEDLLARLESAGCEIERIDGDGTKIASELAER
jgi:hypothetical protein